MATATLFETRVVEVLRQSPQPMLRRLRVDENAHEVVLTGTLPTYFLKQLAQETVLPLLGSRRLVNRIVVI
jgi:hypothetical protein